MAVAHLKGWWWPILSQVPVLSCLDLLRSVRQKSDTPVKKVNAWKRSRNFMTQVSLLTNGNIQNFAEFQCKCLPKFVFWINQYYWKINFHLSWHTGLYLCTWNRVGIKSYICPETIMPFQKQSFKGK